MGSDHRNITVDDTVTVQVLADARGSRVDTALLDIGIPAGFAVDTTPHDALQEDDVISRYELAGRQAIIYIEHMEGRSQLTFDITATQPVEAESGPSTIRSYYDPEQRAVEGPVRFHVTE